jgi:hypothetical protein
MTSWLDKLSNIKITGIISELDASIDDGKSFQRTQELGQLKDELKNHMSTSLDQKIKELEEEQDANNEKREAEMEQANRDELKDIEKVEPTS